MDERMQAAAIATARQLLSNYKAEHPEWQDDRTPIDELSSWLGLDVETFHPNDYPEVLMAGWNQTKTSSGSAAISLKPCAASRLLTNWDTLSCIAIQNKEHQSQGDRKGSPLL